MAIILAIAVHPDDETLGCGGALLRHKANGDEIHWLICTEVRESEGFSPERVESRAKEIEKVAAMYGFAGVHQLHLKTGRTDEYSTTEIVSGISAVVSKIKPHTVYLPFKGDVHSDHRVIFNAAFSCTKTFRYPFVKRVLMIEALSETEYAPGLQGESFIPNVFIDITDFFTRKIEIMRIFAGETGTHPFPRSERNLEALAVYRGASSGCIYAESFMLLKEII